MNPHEADQLARKLKGLLPLMTDAQVLDWAERFERFEFDSAEKAMRDYIESDSELNTPKLLRMLREASAASDDQRDGRMGQNQRLAHEVEEIDRTIAGLSDAELALAKFEILFRLPQWTRDILRERDARSSAMLKAMIFEHLRERNVAVPET